MKAQWEDMRAVLAVVRGGSLAAAGAALGVNYTTVARRVARASEDLGEILFERLTDGYHPTEAGRLVARHAAEMEATTDGLERALSARGQALSGALVLTAPQLLIAHVLAPALNDFAAAHPDIDLHLRASNELLDLNRREADLAIRVSRSPGDSLTGLRLAAQQAASFAAPVWADRIAKAPDGPVDWLVYEGFPDLPAEVTERSPGSRVRMLFDDMVAMAWACAAGLGVVRMPMFLGRRVPGLVQVPLLAPRAYADIWAVAHPDVWRSAKVAALRTALAQDLRRQRALFVA